MTIKDTLLEEGIRFFKDSKRLNKLALVIEKKYVKAKDETSKNVLKQTVSKIKLAASQFEDLEKRYSSNKKIVKDEYKNLKRQYVEIFDYIKKQNIKKILISVGIFSALSVALLISINKLDKFLEYNNALLVKGKGFIPGVATSYTPEGLKRMVAGVCKQQNVSFKLISSIIDKESEWNPGNVNHNKNGTIDYGLMQLNSSNKGLFERIFWDKKKNLI